MYAMMAYQQSRDVTHKKRVIKAVAAVCYYNVLEC